MKPKLIALGVVVGLMALASFLYLDGGRATGNVDAVKVLAAAQTYVRSLQAQGIVVPPSVGLRELVRHGLLREDDVKGFAGAEVVISLVANPRNPQDVLMRARLPDGHELLVHMDGSLTDTKETK